MLLYPNKENLFLENWVLFCEEVLPIMNERVKDPSGVDILRKLNEQQINLNERNAVVLFLLHSLLKPSGKTAAAKPSISDSRKSFLIWAPTQAEFQSQIKQIIDDNLKKKEKNPNDDIDPFARNYRMCQKPNYTGERFFYFSVL